MRASPVIVCSHAQVRAPRDADLSAIRALIEVQGTPINPATVTAVARYPADHRCDLTGRVELLGFQEERVPLRTWRPTSVTVRAAIIRQSDRHRVSACLDALTRAHNGVREMVVVGSRARVFVIVERDGAVFAIDLDPPIT